MLEFDKTFFEEEERCGFVVEPMMKSVWAAQLEVLENIDRICKENGIKYFADWGTLLGAVRHKGFVPWDDDMDICMLRPDYLRFIDVLNNYSNEIKWNGIYNTENWSTNVTRVVNFRGFSIERNILKQYHGCPYEVGVDVFPVDYVPRDKELEEEQKQVIRLIVEAIDLRLRGEHEKFKEIVRKIENACQMNFEDSYPSQQELMILMDEVEGLYGEADADYVTAMHRLVNGQDYYVQKADYDQAVLYKFENIFIPVPVGFDNILKLKYGNYMEMKKTGGSHEYPFYKAILRTLSEKNGQDSIDETEVYVEDVCRKYYIEYLNRDSNPRLELQEDFFRENSESRSVQAAQSEILEEIRRICNKHNICYWAVSETYQGAEEKHGFMDGEEHLTLGMCRQDYLRFLSIIQKELDSWFDYRSIYTHTWYTEDNICVLTDIYDVSMDEYRKRFHGCEYPVAARIVPVDCQRDNYIDNVGLVPFESTFIPVLKEKRPIVSISVLISDRPDTVRKCLDSLLPILKAVPSELILTDTGCGEEVRKIIEEYTYHIIDFTWCRDFSKARNVGLREAKGQWFMYLDDDEWFESTDEIIRFFNSGECDEYNVACYIQRNYYDLDGKEYSDHTVDRIIRINEQLHFEHRVHEAYTGIDIGEKKLMNDYVHHYGYIYKSQEDVYNKYKRNEELLEIECKENPNDMRMWHQFIMNQYLLKNWDRGIEIAREAIGNKSESEYWDACHTDLLYCLEQKEDWNAIIVYGKEFIRKGLFPYESFGILQYMEKAYYKIGEMDKAESLGEEAIKLYNEYKDNSKLFFENQIMRKDFISERAINDMYAYYSMAENRNSDYIVEKSNEQKVSRDNVKYYQGEIRNGFYIEPMMKCAWAAHLEVLMQIDAICKANDIKYFADWGTLLGAVRHNGYIPWDDDLDICMLRPDLEKFLEIMYAKQTNLICLNMYTDPDWGMHATKVINTTRYETDRAFIKEYHGFPFSAGVDIFPIDYVPRDKVQEKKQMDAVRLANELAHLIIEMEEYKTNSRKYKNGADILASMIPKLKKMSESLISQEALKLLDDINYQNMTILVDKLEGACGENDSDYVTAMHRLANGQDYYIPKEGYGDSVLAQFEDVMLPVPVGYDIILKKKYGDGYMTPNNVRGGHDYPFYGQLIDALSQNRGDRDCQTTKKHIEKMSVNYYTHFLSKTDEPSIKYDKDYFETGIIDGCEVTEDRKRIWAAQTEVLEEVRRICTADKIRFWAIGDTVNEAVKYNHYAPQSEDLHLAVLREDFARFIVAVQEGLDAWFNYGTLYTSENHEDMRAYIITDGYMCDEKEYAERFHGCQHIVGADISVIDTVDTNTEMDDMRKTLIEGLIKTSQNVSDVTPYTQEEIAIAEEWQRVTQIKIDIESNLRKELLKAADQIAGSYRGKGEYVRITADLQENQDTILPKKYFDDSVEIVFGNTTIPIPIGDEYEG